MIRMTDWTNREDVEKAYEKHKSMTVDELKQEVRDYRKAQESAEAPIYRMSEEIAQVANLYGL